MPADAFRASVQELNRLLDEGDASGKPISDVLELHYELLPTNPHDPHLTGATEFMKRELRNVLIDLLDTGMMVPDHRDIKRVAFTRAVFMPVRDSTRYLVSTNTSNELMKRRLIERKIVYINEHWKDLVQHSNRFVSVRVFYLYNRPIPKIRYTYVKDEPECTD